MDDRRDASCGGVVVIADLDMWQEMAADDAREQAKIDAELAEERAAIELASAADRCGCGRHYDECACWAWRSVAR